MKDKIMAGSLAGFVGAILQDIYGFFVKVTGLSDRGFIDFARAVISSAVNGGVLETVLAFITHLIWDLMLAILFTYLFNSLSSSYYYYKAIIYGSALWFMIQTVGTLFRLPMFYHIPASAALVTLLGAIIYSLGIAFILRLVETRIHHNQ